MVITDEEASSIKEHLSKQLDNFPEDKRLGIKEKIESMSNSELEGFLKQNKLTHLGGQCIFCSIVAGKTDSYKVGENSENIAILELNPMSKGHTLIVPKDHDAEPPKSANQLATEIGRKINDKFNPKEIKLNKTEIMGHSILELIPIYEDTPLQKKAATEDELKELSKKIKEIKVKEEKAHTKKEPIPILPSRIP